MNFENCTRYFFPQKLFLIFQFLGRKLLNLISLVGSSVGLFALSLYHYLNLSGYDLSLFEWVPVVSLSMVIFISAVGIVPLSMVCTVEYLRPSVHCLFLLLLFILLF